MRGPLSGWQQQLSDRLAKEKWVWSPSHSKPNPLWVMTCPSQTGLISKGCRMAGTSHLPQRQHSMLRWSATPSEWLRMQPSLCYPSQLRRRLVGTFDCGVGCQCAMIVPWMARTFSLSPELFQVLKIHAQDFYSASSTTLAKFSEALFPVKYEVSYYMYIYMIYRYIDICAGPSSSGKL